jgi:hypothetical protein
MVRSRLGLVGGAVLVSALASHAPASAAKKKVDPAAEQMLRKMADYLGGLRSFTVTIFSVDENKLTSGEKIQHTADAEVSVQRPDRLRSVPLGAAEGLGLWYDGKSMTLACKADHTFSTIPAPATIDLAIDTMRKSFKVDAPGADLLYSRPYEILMEQVTAGRVVGRETIGGLAANHLAFEGDEVDWQIWIADGAQPVPLRFVITTKTVKDRPQFSVQMSNWQPQAILPPTTFSFQPPPGATPVKSVAADCSAGR